jgi:hypothetical protein
MAALLAGICVWPISAGASENYPVGTLVQGDDLFACRTEKLALKIQKSGLAPENLGAAIENNDCFFLDRFDHIPRRLILRANDLSVLATEAQGKNARLGIFYIVVP